MTQYRMAQVLPPGFNPNHPEGGTFYTPWREDKDWCIGLCMLGKGSAQSIHRWVEDDQGNKVYERNKP